MLQLISPSCVKKERFLMIDSVLFFLFHFRSWCIYLYLIKWLILSSFSNVVFVVVFSKWLLLFGSLIVVLGVFLFIFAKIVFFFFFFFFFGLFVHLTLSFVKVMSLNSPSTKTVTGKLIQEFIIMDKL